MSKRTIKRSAAANAIQAAAIHSWEPWSKSTGPKTEAGKARSSLNALKHGKRNRYYRAMATVSSEMGKRLLVMGRTGLYIPPGLKEREADGLIQKFVLEGLISNN